MLKYLPLLQSDVHFLVETVSPEVRDRLRLERIVSEDKDIRKVYVKDGKVFRRLMDEEETLFILEQRRKCHRSLDAQGWFGQRI